MDAGSNLPKKHQWAEAGLPVASKKKEDGLFPTVGKTNTTAPVVQSAQSAALPRNSASLDGEVYRTWKSPEDALAWAQDVLPFLKKQELQHIFNEIPAQNGKKAPAWVTKVLEVLESTGRVGERSL